MLNITPLTQRDPKWKSIFLGNTKNTTIGSHGCTITDTAMVLNYLGIKITPAELNEKLKANKGYLNNLIIWDAVRRIWPSVVEKAIRVTGAHGGYNNTKVSEYVYNKKTPVLVEVNAAPIGSPRSSHWVLFVADRKLIDPWDGKIKSTAAYPVRLGYAVFIPKKKIV